MEERTPLPCPFCGEALVLNLGGDMWCHREGSFSACVLGTFELQNSMVMVSIWNTRAPAALADPVLTRAGRLAFLSGYACGIEHDADEPFVRGAIAAWNAERDQLLAAVAECS